MDKTLESLIRLTFKELKATEPVYATAALDMMASMDTAELNEMIRQLKHGYRRPLNLTVLIFQEWRAKYPGMTAELIDLLSQVSDLTALKKLAAAASQGDFGPPERKTRIVQKLLIVPGEPWQTIDVEEEIPVDEAAAQPVEQPAITPASSNGGLYELIGIGWAFGPDVDWRTVRHFEEWAERTYIQMPVPRNAPRAVKHLNRSSHSADPADRVVPAAKALTRMLRGEFEKCALAREAELEEHWQYNDDGEAFQSDEYLEATLSYRGHYGIHNVRIVLIAQDVDKNAFAKLCARLESGRVIKGRSSPETWQCIADAIMVEAQQPPPVRPAPPPPPPDEGPWDTQGRRIGGPRTPPRFLPPRDDPGSGWAG
jgi:hypothetical protein